MDKGKEGNKKIRRIVIEPLEKGFLYTTECHGQKDKEGFMAPWEDYKYTADSVNEILAFVKDDLESPHVREYGGGKGGYSKYMAIKGKKE